MANWRDEVLLEGEFALFPKKKGIYKVTLTRRGLYFNVVSNSSNTFEEKSIQTSDIIGCHLLEPKSNGLQSTSSTESDSSNKHRSNSQLSQGSNYSNDLATDPETIIPTNIGFSKPTDPNVTGFVIFAYPFRKKVFSGKKVRHRVVIAFSSVPSDDIFEERRRIAEKWKNVLNCLCRDIHVNLNEVPVCVSPPRGKFLVLINPHSGPGKALSIFKNEVAPMLQEANIPYKEFVTEYAGHASDLMKEISLAEWNGIVIISGDGLIFEAINGLMSRSDWASSIHVPIGCLPGGSGNALCCSINYSAGEPYDSNFVMHSTFVLIKHRVIPMDLVMVQIPDRTIYSFLSIAWGIVADIDFESEKYRSLGVARFTIGAIRRIFGLRTYKGKISFLPVAEYVPKESPSSDKKVLSKVRRFSLRSRSSSKSTISSSDSSSPRLLSRRSLSLDQNNYKEVQASRNNFLHSDVNSSAVYNFVNKMPENGNGTDNSFNVYSTDSVASSCDDFAETGKMGSSFTSDNKTMHSEKDLRQSTERESPPGTESSRYNNSDLSSPKDKHNLNQNVSNRSPSTVSANRSSSSTSTKSDDGMTVMGEMQEIVVEEEMYQGQKKDYEPVPSPLLLPLDQPVPDNWVCLDGEFVLVCAVYQTHLGPDMLAAPDAHLNDGFIHLIMVREGISRNALLNLFLSFGEGTQICSPHVEIVKVLAFRLEPETDQGNLMIDGERFNPSPCQAQVLPGIAKIMAIK